MEKEKLETERITKREREKERKRERERDRERERESVGRVGREIDLRDGDERKDHYFTNF